MWTRVRHLKRPFVICCVSQTVAARVTCAFRLGSHTFPEKIMTGIVFCIGHGLLRVLVCDNLISQTVRESLRTCSSAANRLWSAMYHRRFCYDWHMLSDVDHTHSFSLTMCEAIARLKQKYPILNRHAKSKFATIFNWTNKQNIPFWIGMQKANSPQYSIEQMVSTGRTFIRFHNNCNWTYGS